MLATMQRMTTTGPRSGGSRFFASPPCAWHRAPRSHATRPAHRSASQKLASGFLRSSPAPHARKVAAQAADERPACTIFSYQTVSGYTVAPNSAGNSTTTAGTQTVTYTVVTVIRPPDFQAGVKSSQTITVNPATGQLVSNTYLTGHTTILGVNLPSRSDSFTASSSSTPAGYKVNITGETGSWGVPLNINYNVQLYYNNTTGTVSIRGAHDGYPSYEIHQGGVKIYDHQQGNIGQLGGSGDVTIKTTWP